MFVSLTNDQLEDELAAQAAHVDAGLARLLELVAECDRRGGRLIGDPLPAWLAWRCSLLPRQAREYARVAERLPDLPLIRAAFARGELSYAKVSVLTKIADAESERELLELAEVLTASQLERAVGAFRRLTREQAAEHEERAFVDWFWTEDDMLSLRGLLAPDEGAVVLRALEAARDALRARSGAEGVEAGRPTNADALVAVAELALASPDGTGSSADRYQVVVHVDAQTLAADADGRCELEAGRPLAAETARRIACDGSLLDLGRKRRTVSAPLRRVLNARDRGCRFPGCENTRFVDAHHVRHWSRGGETKLDNLVSLCRRHHRLVHESGYTVELSHDGAALFRNQYGIAIPNVPRSPPSNPDALASHHRDRGIEIDAKTCRNGDGDRMDLALAVDAILAAAC